MTEELNIPYIITAMRRVFVWQEYYDEDQDRYVLVPKDGKPPEWEYFLVHPERPSREWGWVPENKIVREFIIQARQQRTVKEV